MTKYFAIFGTDFIRAPNNLFSIGCAVPQEENLADPDGLAGTAIMARSQDHRRSSPGVYLRWQPIKRCSAHASVVKFTSYHGNQHAHALCSLSLSLFLSISCESQSVAENCGDDSIARLQMLVDSRASFDKNFGVTERKSSGAFAHSPIRVASSRACRQI